MDMECPYFGSSLPLCRNFNKILIDNNCLEESFDEQLEFMHENLLFKTLRHYLS